MLLSISNLTKEYQRGASSFRAVDNVSLQIDQSDFVSVIGRSGSGKSTLLNLVAGLVRPTSGGIRVLDADVLSLNDKDASAYRNERIGVIPQGQSTLANLTVLDNVRLPHYLKKRGDDPTKRALSLLGEVGIAHLAQAYPRHLSGGELRRVSIARALLNSPSLLLADEPTSDLDAQTTREVMELFAAIAKKGTAVLLVTHELDTTSYGNRIFVMDAGTLREGIKAD